MKSAHRSVSLLVLQLLITWCGAWAQIPTFDGKAQLTPTIVADTAAVEAGKPFTVGVRFAIKDQWYIYYRFVGDIGLPTSVEWELPPGFKAGALQWPLPAIHEGTGDFLNYVYEHDTLLFAEITPPAQLPVGPLTIKAKLNWQVCDPQTCVPGSGEVSLVLPVGAAQPANAELFAKWRNELPKREGRPFSVKWERGATEVKLHLAGLPKEFKADFIPLPPKPEIKVGHPTVGEIAADGARTITVPIIEGGAAGLAWEGVIATAKGEAPREGWLVAANDGEVPESASPAGVSGVTLFGTLWAAFLGGLILNLMPCVCRSSL